MSAIGPVQSRYHEAVQTVGKEVYVYRPPNHGVHCSH